MAGSETNVAHLRAIGVLCQQAGLRVLEAGGWTTRGRDWAKLRPEYAVAHHTAAPVDVDRLLIEGRTDLPGPLANIALHADGTVVLIASGLANHAGVATISSAQAWGIEATGPIPTGNTGADAFPQYGAYVILCAAIRVHHGWPSERVVGHKEIARPLGRKVDPAFDMDAFRAAVDRYAPAWGGEDDVLNDDDRKWIEARLDAHTKELVGKVEALYKLAARGELNGAIDETSTHYADSVRGTREIILDAVAPPEPAPPITPIS